MSDTALQDATTTDSSPVTPQTSLDTASEADRLHWRKTGELPGRAAPTPTADSSPASPAEPAASTEASESAGSDPATPGKSKGKGAEARKAELAAEIQASLKTRADLRAELDRLADEVAQRRQQVTSPDVASRSSRDTSPAAEAEPTPGQFSTYEDYTRAVARWEAKQEFVAQQQQQTATQREQARTQAITAKMDAARQRWEQAVAKDADVVSRVNPALLDATPVSLLPAGTPVQPQHVLAEEVLSSDQMVPLLVHLSEHPETVTKLLAMTPTALIRAIGRLEATLDAPAPSTPAVPPVKTVTSAPPATTTLGQRPTADADELIAAIKAGDYRAYAAAQNRREIAARR